MATIKRGMLYADKDGNVLEISEVKGGRVRFCRQGGGFVQSMAAAAFRARFRPAPPFQFKEGRVTGEWFCGAEPLRCYLDGRRWNGWAMPYFLFEEARVAAGMGLGGLMRYDARRDAFVLADNGSDEECYAAVQIEVQGALVKAYPVGAGAWCWEEVTP